MRVSAVELKNKISDLNTELQSAGGKLIEKVSLWIRVLLFPLISSPLTRIMSTETRTHGTSTNATQYRNRNRQITNMQFSARHCEQDLSADPESQILFRVEGKFLFIALWSR
jgi:hypothetical protein